MNFSYFLNKIKENVLSFFHYLNSIKNDNFVEKLLEEGISDDYFKSDLGKLNKALKAGGVGTFEWNFVKETFSLSDFGLEIYGLQGLSAPESLEDFFGMIHPNDRDLVKNGFNKVKNKNMELCLEHRIVMPAGRIKKVLIKGKSEIDFQNDLVGVVGIVISVAEYENEIKELAPQTLECNT